MFESLSDRFVQRVPLPERPGAAHRGKYPRWPARGASCPVGADVNFKVVKELVERVRERVLGQEVEKKPDPHAAAAVKAVHDELRYPASAAKQPNWKPARRAAARRHHDGPSGFRKTIGGQARQSPARKQKMRP